MSAAKLIKALMHEYKYTYASLGLPEGAEEKLDIESVEHRFSEDPQFEGKSRVVFKAKSDSGIANREGGDTWTVIYKRINLYALRDKLSIHLPYEIKDLKSEIAKIKTNLSDVRGLERLYKDSLEDLNVDTSIVDLTLDHLLKEYLKDSLDKANNASDKRGNYINSEALTVALDKKELALRIPASKLSPIMLTASPDSDIYEGSCEVYIRFSYDYKDNQVVRKTGSLLALTGLLGNKPDSFNETLFRDLFGNEITDKLISSNIPLAIEPIYPPGTTEEGKDKYNNRTVYPTVLIPENPAYRRNYTPYGATRDELLASIYDGIHPTEDYFGIFKDTVGNVFPSHIADSRSDSPFADYSEDNVEDAYNKASEKASSGIYDRTGTARNRAEATSNTFLCSGRTTLTNYRRIRSEEKVVNVAKQAELTIYQCDAVTPFFVGKHPFAVMKVSIPKIFDYYCDTTKHPVNSRDLLPEPNVVVVQGIDPDNTYTLPYSVEHISGVYVPIGSSINSRTHATHYAWRKLDENEYEVYYIRNVSKVTDTFSLRFKDLSVEQIQKDPQLLLGMLTGNLLQGKVDITVTNVEKVGAVYDEGFNADFTIHGENCAVHTAFSVTIHLRYATYQPNE